jgi:hypothetical protein
LFGLPWQRAGIGDLLVLAPIKGAENQSRRNRDGNRTAENHSRENQTAKSHFPLPRPMTAKAVRRAFIKAHNRRLRTKSINI